MGAQPENTPRAAEDTKVPKSGDVKGGQAKADKLKRPDATAAKGGRARGAAARSEVK